MISGHAAQSQETLPGRVLKRCAQPMCRELVESGRCPKHRAQIDKRRGTSTERGYDAAFRLLRVECFERDQWTCKDCGWQPPIVEQFTRLSLPMPRAVVILDELREMKVRNLPHLHADHVLPIEERPDLRLVLSNLQTLCNSCHARKTRHEQRGGVETK